MKQHNMAETKATAAKTAVAAHLEKALLLLTTGIVSVRYYEKLDVFGIQYEDGYSFHKSIAALFKEIAGEVDPA